MSLDNTKRARIIQEAIDQALYIDYGLFHLRVALFEALAGSELNADFVAEKLLPRSGNFTDVSMIDIQLLVEMIKNHKNSSLADLTKYVLTIKLVTP